MTRLIVCVRTVHVPAEARDRFLAWIDTPDRDRLTDSEVHRAVSYGPITRYDVAGGYPNLDGLRAFAERIEEDAP